MNGKPNKKTIGAFVLGGVLASVVQKLISNNSPVKVSDEEIVHKDLTLMLQRLENASSEYQKVREEENETS